MRPTPLVAPPCSLRTRRAAPPRTAVADVVMSEADAAAIAAVLAEDEEQALPIVVHPTAGRDPGAAPGGAGAGAGLRQPAAPQQLPAPAALPRGPPAVQPQYPHPAAQQQQQQQQPAHYQQQQQQYPPVPSLHQPPPPQQQQYQLQPQQPHHDLDADLAFALRLQEEEEEALRQEEEEQRRLQRQQQPQQQHGAPPPQQQQFQGQQPQAQARVRTVRSEGRGWTGGRGWCHVLHGSGKGLMPCLVRQQERG
jgi:hypothetical protein